MASALAGPVRRNLYWIAILSLVLMPLGAWILVSHDEDAQGAAYWAGFALFLAGLAAFCVAMGSRHHRVTIKDEAELDERELAQRYRAGALAFRLYWLATLLGCFYLQFAPRFGAPVPAGRDWFWVMLVLADLFLLLPIVILEWSSDPLTPEEEDE